MGAGRVLTGDGPDGLLPQFDDTTRTFVGGAGGVPVVGGIDGEGGGVPVMGHVIPLTSGLAVVLLHGAWPP
jgi:hypothetical protein